MNRKVDKLEFRADALHYGVKNEVKRKLAKLLLYEGALTITISNQYKIQYKIICRRNAFKHLAAVLSLEIL